MGLLDGIFGGGKSGGGASPITLGLLALLAYRTYQGKGRLADMLGRGEEDKLPTGSATPGRSPGEQSLDRTAGPTGSGEGGLGSILGDLMRGAGGRQAGGTDGGGGLADLLKGGLGGLLGGAAGGSVLNGGLKDLLGRLGQNGQAETADSWVGKGENRRIAPKDLEGALGRDTVQTLSEQSGRPYDEVLSELSESLPDTVNRLTPEGRPPTDEEASRWT